MLSIVQVDGKPDIAKLAALAAHCAMFAAFVRLQVIGGEFNEAIWLVYGGFALLHDGFNRTTAMLKDRSDRQQAAGATPHPTTTTVVTTAPAVVVEQKDQT